MFINNLNNSKLLVDVEEEKIKEVLSCAGIDGKRRGETRSVEPAEQLIAHTTGSR
jgi:hypothetical protein